MRTVFENKKVMAAVLFGIAAICVILVVNLFSGSANNNAARNESALGSDMPGLEQTNMDQDRPIGIRTEFEQIKDYENQQELPPLVGDYVTFPFDKVSSDFVFRGMIIEVEDVPTIIGGRKSIHVDSLITVVVKNAYGDYPQTGKEVILYSWESNKNTGRGVFFNLSVGEEYVFFGRTFTQNLIDTCMERHENTDVVDKAEMYIQDNYAMFPVRNDLILADTSWVEDIPATKWLTQEEAESISGVYTNPSIYPFGKACYTEEDFIKALEHYRNKYPS